MKTLTSLLVYGFAFTLLLVTLYSLYLHESARPSEYDIGGNKESVVWNVAGQRSLQAKAEAPRFRSRHRWVFMILQCIIDAATINHCVLITDFCLNSALHPEICIYQTLLQKPTRFPSMQYLCFHSCKNSATMHVPEKLLKIDSHTLLSIHSDLQLSQHCCL